MTSPIFASLRQRLPTSMPRRLLAPLTGLALFLLLWQGAALQVQTSLGPLPGPADVWHQANSLMAEHWATSAIPAPEYPPSAEMSDPEPHDSSDIPAPPYRSSAPTFPAQVAISLATVLAGFGLATLIAIPLGIALGLSTTLHRVLDPLIQLLRPISPLAWLPLVTLVVGTRFADTGSLLGQSFIVALLTVLLCCLWPTVINTAAGISSVDDDWLNVSRVLRLDTLTHLRKIVIPAALPAIFTGLRLSLSIAWMVLVAAEMLAHSPGLGKFIWDEFQSGSPHSLARILVAVITIGAIGLLLDRLMLGAQRALSWDVRAIR